MWVATIIPLVIVYSHPVSVFFFAKILWAIVYPQHLKALHFRL